MKHHNTLFLFLMTWLKSSIIPSQFIFCFDSSTFNLFDHHHPHQLSGHLLHHHHPLLLLHQNLDKKKTETEKRLGP